jgi:hypothetical protein
MFLCVSHYAHDNESHYDKSDYEVLRHGCNSTGLANYEAGEPCGQR